MDLTHAIGAAGWGRGLGRTLAVAGILLASTAATGAAQTSSLAPTSSVAPASSGAPDASLRPGDQRVTGQVLGTGSYPTYTLDVPDGWEAGGHFTVKSFSDPDPVMGVSVWDVGQVYGDPCHWQGTLADPGPTVDDLVAALVAQPTRNATAPVDVTLAGYAGRHLEWSVPADMVVTGDSDFAGCDIEPSNGHRDFNSWVGNGQGSRYQQVAGQVDRLWILDVDGQRLLVDATYSPDTTEADRNEQQRVVESLRFQGP
jgi:hypothetical protein